MVLPKGFCLFFVSWPILALSGPILDHFGCTLATTWPLLGAHLGVHGHVWVPAVHGHVWVPCLDGAP